VNSYLNQYLSWRDESFEEEYGPALILRNANLLLVLKGTQTLKHVCIQFGAQFVDDPVAVSRSYVPLRGFRNLTSLELYDFYRDHNYLVKDIAYFLCDSPFLMKLGLGFATERTHDDDEAVYFGGPDREADFLERLCEFYGSICKNGPLALETLRLGSGIYLGEPSNPTNGHYLPKLLTVRSLKVLHVCNGLVNSDLDDEDSFYRPVDWTPFTSEECKSLLQLSVARLEEDVTCWLRQGGNCVQELIVTDHYSFNDQGINQFFNIPLSQLSMLWVREKHPWQQSLYEDSDWSDTDSSISDWDLDSSTSDQSTSESSNSQLSHSDPTQPSPLKPNAPKLDKLVMTVLDRLPDGGSHLTRLCIALDFETQWVSDNPTQMQNIPSLPKDTSCISPLT
jgi:hypothetical protein